VSNLFLGSDNMDTENCVKYFGPNTPTSLTPEECNYMVTKEGAKFTKPGFFSKASGKTKSNRPIDFVTWKSFYRDEQARKARLETPKAPVQPAPVAPVQPVAPIQPAPVAPVQTVVPVSILPKEKSAFYEDFKNGKYWVQCKEGQAGCVPYAQLHVDDMSGERSCNLAVVNNGRENVVYDGTKGTVMTLEKKCERKPQPRYLRGGKRTRRTNKSKRKTRR